MSELPIKGIKAARCIIAKNGDRQWRCGWSTQDGRGCSQVFGVLSLDRSIDGCAMTDKLPCIKLLPGYDQRPKDHQHAGVFFFSHRPGLRFYKSKDIKERFSRVYKLRQQKFNQDIEETEKYLARAEFDLLCTAERIAELRAYIQSCKDDRGADHVSMDSHVWQQEKSRRAAWPIHLVMEQSVPLSLDGLFTLQMPWEKFLPAVICCKTCYRYSRITSTEFIP